MKISLFFFLFLNSFLFLNHPVLADEIRVSAAASLTDVMKELVRQYNTDKPDVSFRLNFASSGSLAKQISLGASTDIFVSAHPKWMEFLIESKKIGADSVRKFALNSLVFVGPRESSVKSFADLLSLNLIAIGSPKSVPVGQYAFQAMTANGVYAKLLQERKLVMAKDVRQALIYAERAEVDGAFVYRTDALQSQKAVVLFEVDAKYHDLIVYPCGLTDSGKGNKVAVDFYNFLVSEKSVAILHKYGFIEPENK